MQRNAKGYKLPEQEKADFEEVLREIKELEGFEGTVYITDDWHLGYCKSCSVCGKVKMYYVDYQIPYHNAHNKELEEIVSKYAERYILAECELYEKGVVCRCD